MRCWLFPVPKRNGSCPYAGVLLPIAAARTKRMRVPPLAFFITKYFGSGVIIATAFIHVSLQSAPISITTLLLTYSSFLRRLSGLLARHVYLDLSRITAGQKGLPL
jgi:hypothetical protein